MRGSSWCPARFTVVVFSLLLSISAQLSGGSTGQVYEPTTESLRRHRAPRWFEDAKLGIFIHWGPYAVPAYHEWYLVFISPKANFGFFYGGPPYLPKGGHLAAELYQRLTRQEAVRYHRRRWGENFSYDDFIPMFRAQKFDPQAWAQLFQEAGARYVVFTAKHGDEFAMWPSRLTKRNAGAMGPRRDVAGELLKAVRSRGLKMGFYHNTTYSFWDSRYPGRDWVRYMNDSIRELIDLYHPDLLWGDVRIGPVRDRDGRPLPADYWGAKQVLAYFYNHSPEPDEVVANDRWGPLTDGSFLGDYTTYERRVPRKPLQRKWELCESLDPYSWGYRQLTRPGEYMSANELIDLLIDVVSKNGNLLINIGPRADGTIPEIMARTLRETGRWLAVNGEAIYGTRPWRVFREGDFRFTVRRTFVYAIGLEWTTRELYLTSFAGEKVKEVTLLGSEEQVEWSMHPDGLRVVLPQAPPTPYAFTLRIALE